MGSVNSELLLSETGVIFSANTAENKRKKVGELLNWLYFFVALKTYETLQNNLFNIFKTQNY